MRANARTAAHAFTKNISSGAVAIRPHLEQSQRQPRLRMSALHIERAAQKTARVPYFTFALLEEGPRVEQLRILAVRKSVGLLHHHTHFGRALAAPDGQLRTRRADMHAPRIFRDAGVNCLHSALNSASATLDRGERDKGETP